MSTAAENKEIVRRYYEEAFNESRTDLLEELVSENVVNHDPVSDETLTPEEARGFEGFVRHVEAAHEAFPDATVTIEDVIAEDDMVAVRFTFTGTHEGPFAGFNPTGERLEGSNMVFMRLEDGKITERWEESDSLDALEQLGILSVADLSPSGDRTRKVA
ncbi:ester cyclase [Natronosalvus rutilus]|uniref:Ester cyclase n=1 Tax=Natronosalvus rutilus TaxID=2953753 RepID=A0A9E7NDX4_9EURY|nr:ester cyclase [Natronosalvus rutilus]UTF55190.1 ester cyclase [Natronosalvus rutilus]